MATKRKTITKSTKNQKSAVNKTACNPISKPGDTSKTKSMTQASKPTPINTAPKMSKPAPKPVSKPVPKAASKPVARPLANPSAPKPMAPSTKSIQFSYYAPDANQVCLAGDFNNWSTNSCHLTKTNSGEWRAALSLKPGVYDYKFFVDGEWREDPKSSQRVPNTFGTQNDRIIVK
ncbi:MAG: hypothetical protein ACMUIM_04095 [bacterium]